MRKILIISIVTSLLFGACEKDDFCIEPVTPKLILRFYDITNNTDLKNVDPLYVWAEGRDTIFDGVSTDSIYIPLELNQLSTVYNLSKGDTTDQITINYEIEEEYVSRSCGFRAIFNNVTVESTNNWIQSFTPESLPVINNETTAHVQVFH